MMGARNRKDSLERCNWNTGSGATLRVWLQQFGRDGACSRFQSFCGKGDHSVLIPLLLSVRDLSPYVARWCAHRVTSDGTA